MNRRGFLSGIGIAFAGVAVPSFGGVVLPDISAAEITFSEIVTNTLRASREALAANIVRHNALLQRLKDSGAICPWQEGMPIDYEERD